MGESTDATEPPRITVFLADDSLLVREGVRALLAAQADREFIRSLFFRAPAMGQS